jgi:hypothetical protein
MAVTHAAHAAIGTTTVSRTWVSEPTPHGESVGNWSPTRISAL